MSHSDVPMDEMRWLSDIADRDAERLFAGNMPEDDPKLGDVAHFLDEVREAYPETPAASCEAAHLSAMMDAAHLLAENGEPAVRQASNAHGPAEQVAGLPKWRRSPLMQKIAASTKLKVVLIAAAVLLLAFAGTAFAASQGALPAPMQKAVANTAGAIGLDVPDVPDAIEIDDVDLDEQDVLDVSDPAEQADQLDVDDDAQGNVDEGDLDDEQIDAADEADELDADESDSSDDNHDAVSPSNGTGGADEDSKDSGDTEQDESPSDSQQSHDGDSGDSGD